ncbi:endo-1,3-beta-glucanase Engl1 [Talaromyces proteolyticus]|uniref:glucan endo-1,3-beta-D-glucosidase n=1 Tax=Talaromyces proteolyticus TaxID=1131652 RepID=A0AAD4PXW5_9EURO|nr:endo-1,3-beta-glucanase Engl1 [Talaromyces proteolyticus]KAH8700490.1 endo-1,3-beta-glucanase Engl1 [Talaromyces proteolyticus]
MQRHITWLFPFVLTWSQAIQVASCYQKREHVSIASSVDGQSAQSTTSFTTLYPPQNSFRVLKADTKGVYNTQLEREGHPSLLPFPLPSIDLGIGGNAGVVTETPSPTGSSDEWTTTVIETVTVTLPLSDPTSVSSQGTPQPSTPASTTQTLASPVHATETPQSAAKSASMNGQDVFETVSLDAVPSNIPTKNDHPVPQLGIVNTTSPVETNKFYANFFLGNQTTPSFTHPYSLSWAKGSGAAESWGMAISHTDMNQLVYGNSSQSIPGNPVEYYLNPIGLQSLIMSAKELGKTSVLNTDRMTGFSADVILKPSNGSTQSITFPVLQGMGFVTGIYSGLQPQIQSSILFRNVVVAGSPRPGTYKYQITLEDSKDWLMYVTPDDGMAPNFNFTTSTTTLQGPAGFSGTIQIAKNPAGAGGEAVYDQSAGVYAKTATISGAVTDSTGTYTLSWEKRGNSTTNTPLLMFAFSHHMQSFDANTKSGLQAVQLHTTTKGNATALLADSWTMTEPNLPVDMDFAPWSPSFGSISKLSPDVIQTVLDSAKAELTPDVDAQSNLNSMYYSGKVLSKFATLVYTVNTLANDPQTAAATLDGLKKAFARFVDNQQQYPLVYDNVWKGVVSSAAFVTNDLNQDFGNGGYNDHHFHYGYFIHAAAIIGALDPSWIDANKAWVNMLVRDAGNSASNDPSFPFSRAFDWFHGHSWAKGLFESADGKDEESTSEDAMFAYAVKMWGKTSGDKSMEARGNLMLAILRRSLSNYFLMEDNNFNQPRDFIGNRVTGILFENKAHHTTYFGTNLEFIQGIHMLPLLPSSAYTRNQSFVEQEWNSMFAEQACDPASAVASGGWKGVLYANRAITNPQESYAFFKQSNFNLTWIDGGATRTWYLAYAAGSELILVDMLGLNGGTI